VNVYVVNVVPTVPTAVVLMLNYIGISSGNAFGLILDFSGGLAGSITSFIMPAAFYLRLQPTTAYLYWPCAVMLVVGIAIAVMVPILSIMQYT
jgi:amino acid permease